MTFELTKEQIKNPKEVSNIICNCQYGDVYTDKETGEILFMEDDDGWKSFSREFAEVLRKEYNRDYWWVTYDDGKNEVHVKNVDDLDA